MNRRERVPLYKAETKVIFEGMEPGTYIHYFKDAVQVDNETHEIHGKGAVNNRLSEMVMVTLGSMGIPTHFIRRLNMREQVVRALDLLKVKVVVRNTAAGTFVSRFGLEEGMRLPRPIVEFLWQQEGHPFQYVSEEHITAFGWAAPAEIEEMTGLALRINDFLTGLFFAIGVQLVDCKLQFGRCYSDFHDESRLVLADEITPDGCRLLDIKSQQKFDRGSYASFSTEGAFDYQEIGRRFGFSGPLGVVPQKVDGE